MSTVPVGRGEACHLLDSVVDRVACGGSPYGAVIGDAGTGRSTLLARAAARAERAGVTVVRVGPVLGVDGHRWCRAVIARAAARRVLVVADDVDRPGTGSHERIAMLLRRRRADVPGATGPGVLVAAGPADDVPAADSPGSDDVLVRIGHLHLAAVGAVCAQVLGIEPDRALVVRARRETGGNPALLAATLDRLPPGPPTAAALSSAAAVARRIRVAAQLDRLPTDLVTALRALAVCGEDLPLVLGRLVGPAVSWNDGVRARLRATGLVVGPRLRPAAPVVVEEALARVEPDDLRALFRRAVDAAVGAGLPDEVVAALAGPAPVLGRPVVAETLSRVAVRRRRDGRLGDAVTLLERALDEPLPVRQHVAVVGDLARARSHHDPGSAGRLVMRAGAGAAAVGGALRTADAFLCRGEVRRARQMLERGAQAASTVREHQELAAMTRLADELGFVAAPTVRVAAGASAASGPSGPSWAAGITAWALAVRARERERAVGLARSALGGMQGDGWRGDGVPVAARLAAVMALDAAGHSIEAAVAVQRLVLALRTREPVPATVLALAALTEFRAGDLLSARRDLRAAHEAPSLRDHGRETDPLLDAVTILLHLTDTDLDAALAVARAPRAPDTDRPGAALLRCAVGLAERRAGSMRASLDAFLAGGRLLLDQERVNPAIGAWRSAAAGPLVALGQPEAAARFTADEMRLARRWGAPRPIAAAERGRQVALGEHDAAP